MKIFHLFSRYLFLLILGAGGLFIFYLILTPLTIYPSFWIISYFYDSILLRGEFTSACSIASDYLPSLKNIACINTTIFFKGYFASIVPACIAGSAYYLLLILNLSTPMPLKKRIKSLIFILISFLILNIIRISSFAMLFAVKGYEAFNLAHIATWYFGSTILVIFIWFFNVILFKISSIPIYTDIKTIMAEIRGKK